MAVAIRPWRNIRTLSVHFATTQSNSDLRRLSASHTITTHTTSLNQLSAPCGANTYNNHKRRISMPSAAFETAILATEPPQTNVLDRAATSIGTCQRHPTNSDVWNWQRDSSPVQTVLTALWAPSTDLLHSTGSLVTGCTHPIQCEV